MTVIEQRPINERLPVERKRHFPLIFGIRAKIETSKWQNDGWRICCGAPIIDRSREKWKLPTSEERIRPQQGQTSYASRDVSFTFIAPLARGTWQSGAGLEVASLAHVIIHLCAASSAVLFCDSLPSLPPLPSLPSLRHDLRPRSVNHCASLCRHSGCLFITYDLTIGDNNKVCRAAVQQIHPVPASSHLCNWLPGHCLQLGRWPPDGSPYRHCDVVINHDGAAAGRFSAWRKLKLRRIIWL